MIKQKACAAGPGKPKATIPGDTLHIAGKLRHFCNSDGSIQREIQPNFAFCAGLSGSGH
ncbi:hypothetical protein KMZ68_23850 [Bradyrhizobium sediminis]|uniref:Uncharacterized protein n=1 Tax=Bradyrhizobium sediminis TaxID=2840469 RepID=A0A975NMK9_9BRAD|nr:hypothetical protein [Bradyrhizobium sediminis]QWG17948.1 hypothetical protein KMZ68_23850 [Bradyrhizobium sediminis]